MDHVLKLLNALSPPYPIQTHKIIIGEGHLDYKNIHTGIQVIDPQLTYALGFFHKETMVDAAAVFYILNMDSILRPRYDAWMEFNKLRVEGAKEDGSAFGISFKNVFFCIKIKQRSDFLVFLIKKDSNRFNLNKFTEFLSGFTTDYGVDVHQLFEMPSLRGIIDKNGVKRYAIFTRIKYDS